MNRKARTKPRPKLSKLESERRHARDRAESRYGIDLTPTLERSIIEKIATSKSTLVERQSLRVSVHDVQLDDGGPVVRVVYDRNRKALVTFLPAPDDAPVRRPSP